MHLSITLEPGHPPTGSVSVQGGAPQPFDSWIALLGILSAVAEQAAEAAPTTTLAPTEELDR